jgi:predicted TIM-barrel fold metal-dependent hydrolase
MKTLLFTALILSSSVLFAASPPEPRIDYHQHLISPAFAEIVKMPVRDGRALLAELDAAHIERAVVLSVGYSFSDERKNLEDPDRLTREENDWTAGEVNRSGGRLVGFCSANPLRDAALAELERCLKLPGMRGIKLHLGNSGISLRDAQQRARVENVFTLAQRTRATVLVHMRARGGQNYGAEDAQIFLNHLPEQAPDVDIVIAHLGSAGPGYAQADELMAVFGEAAKRKDARMRRLYFDVATNVTSDTTPEEAALIVKRIREVGPKHILYGSDLSPPGGSIARGWEIFRTKLPLTDKELRTIATNELKL